MPGLYTNGFSFQQYNNDQKRKQRNAEREARELAEAAEKAKEHLNALQNGRMVSLSCDDKAVVNALKGLVKGDSRYRWTYDNSNRIHFAGKKKTAPVTLKPSQVA